MQIYANKSFSIVFKSNFGVGVNAKPSFNNSTDLQLKIDLVN